MSVLKDFVTIPRVTITVPIRNEEHRIGRLLHSIRSQTYPQDRVELLIVDAGSTDRSVDICEQFNCTIMTNASLNAEIGKEIGATHALGDLHMYMDADMEWSDRHALCELIRPWLEDSALVGSFPRYDIDPSDPAFNRYMSSDRLYQDPLMRFLSPRVEETIVMSRGSYFLCDFVPGNVPIVGVMVYRTSFVRDVLESSGPSWRWIDGDFAMEAAHRRLGPFAYVPTARLFHRSAMTRRIYLEKLRRNVRTVYLAENGGRRTNYLMWDNRRDLARLAGWLLYANLVLPGLAAGAKRAWRLRDPAMLYEAWATTVGTNYVALQFINDPRGRALLRSALRSMLPSKWSFPPAGRKAQRQSREETGPHS